MQAVLYCCLDVVERDKHTMQEVFVMPADGVAIHHISSPCASCNSPISKAICHAIANNERQFTIENRYYTIMNYKVYNHDYVHQYKEPPLFDFINDQSSPVVIHVYAGRTLCAIQEHPVKDIRALILNLYTQQPVIINIFYCPVCKKYSMHKSALNEYAKQKIFPAAKFRYYDFWYDNDYGMNSQSVLAQYGYNTRAGGMPAFARHRLLAALIYHEILSRREIIDHLWFCIEMPGSRPNMKNACDKWRADIEFVHQLPINNPEAVYGILTNLQP